MNAVEFIGVRKIYNGDGAVKDVTMAIREGAFVVLMGSSGSGKTTLLKMINRLIVPSSGKVLFFGEDNASLDLTELRKKIGYVLQSAALFPHRTVARNIATVPEILKWDKERIRARVDELLELMGMQPDEFRNRYPSQLSGGQQQRVGIARAMAGEPAVLLMDEPFGSLDAITRARLQEDLRAMQERAGTTILFVTHDVDEAFRLGDKVAIMSEGSLVQYDTPDFLLRFPASGYISKLLGFLSVEGIRRAQARG